MTNSILLDIVYRNCLSDYRKELENDSNNFNFNEFQEAKAQLSEGLSEEKIKQINNLLLQHLNYLDYINWCVSKKLLEHGILIGMQLQEAFEEILN